MCQFMRLIIIRTENNSHSQINQGKEKETNEKNNITSINFIFLCQNELNVIKVLPKVEGPITEAHFVYPSLFVNENYSQCE